MNLENYRIGKQPCGSFDPQEREHWGGLVEHVCPVCLSLRMFCSNCHQNHHEGGWGTCNEKTMHRISEERRKEAE